MSDTETQEFMHQCLVRQVLKWRVEDRAKATDFLDGWDRKHPGSGLRSDVMIQWKLGNRGKDGVWLT